MNKMEYLNTLVGQPLRYGAKSPDTELYDFGFGDEIEVDSPHWGRITVCPLVLHALCRFRVISRDAERRVDTYYEDTPSEQFHQHIKHLLGFTVKRVGVSDKHDLWLDLGDYWMVFATYENGEESWRFFHYHSDKHLVASDLWMDFLH